MDQDGSGLWVQRTIQGCLVEVKSHKLWGTCFAIHLGSKEKTELFLGGEIVGIKSKNGFY